MTSLLAARSASARPRVENIPPYASSAGQEAIELAASAGLILDPWQQHVLTASLGERPDGKWSAGEVGLIVPRQNGKGCVLEARELFGLVLAEEHLILHSAHLFKTSKEAFRRLLALFQNTPDLDRRVKKVSNTNGDEGIELRNGCRIAFVARSKGGGRGLSGDVIVLDEAFALVDEQIEALAPTLIARPNTQVWYTSSPPLDAATGAPLFALKARGERGDTTLAWFDYGRPAGVDIDDPAEWEASNPATESGRVTVEKLAMLRRAMSAEGFGREILGIWPETAGEAVISPELWADLADSGAAKPTLVAFAVDVTPMRDHAAISMAGYRTDGLVQVALVDHRPGTDWIVARLADLKTRYNPVAIAIDGKGPASTLLMDLAKAGLSITENRERPMRGDLAVATTPEATTAYGLFVDAVRQRRLHHSDDAPLNVALAGAKPRPLGDGSAWARRGATDISPLVAATLSHWALTTRADAVRYDYAPAAYWI